jgi:hypothetical protein
MNLAYAFRIAGTPDAPTPGDLPKAVQTCLIRRDKLMNPDALARDAPAGEKQT